MLTLVTCRAFRTYSPQVAGNSYLPLVLLAESLTASWTLEPGLSSHSQGRGWSQGARHRDIHRKDLQLFGSEEESTTCKQLEILQPDQYVWSFKEVWLSSLRSASFLTSLYSLFIQTQEEGPWLQPDLQSLACYWLPWTAPGFHPTRLCPDSQSKCSIGDVCYGGTCLPSLG